MEFSKTLIMLAAMSPKEYAKKIRVRNQSLLKKLMLLKPYLDKPLGEIPDSVMRDVINKTEYGCPHCHGCTGCLWTKVTHARTTHVGMCSNVKFDGVSLNDLNYIGFYGRGAVTVYYTIHSEGITVGGVECYHDTYMLNPESILDKDSWEKSVRFVKAHIEWTKLPYWGAEYKHDNH